jgi:molecular chaperone DnaK
LRVVDHAGDNFLGGKDIDQALLELVLAEARAQARGGAGARAMTVDRNNPRARRGLARLRAACEQAKIELSRAREAVVGIPADLDAAGPARDAAETLEVVVTRPALERLIAPIVDRSLALVRALLDENHRGPDEVGRVVLVGGPTLTPLVRARLADLFGGRIADGIDPMTIVARGAALYAGTAGLDARPRASAAATTRRGLAVRIEHPAVTADREPFVVGRFLPIGGERLPARVRIERADGGFTGPPVELSAEGSFVAQVKLDRGKQNQFRLIAEDAAGAPVALATDRFTIVQGVSIADPPLGRSVGVACADDLVQVYFAKGTPLPARKTFIHHTAQAVAADAAQDALSIPVVQGESSRPHRNRLIGVLRVRGAREDLPAGSRIEVTLQLDRSGQLHARADVPALGQTFEEIVHLLVPTASLDTVAREIETAGTRADGVQRRAFEAGAPAVVEGLAGVAGLLLEAERSLPAAQDGDADAAQKVHRLLLDANTALDDAEAVLEWPDLQSEARRSALYYTPLVAAWGTAAEQQLFDQVLQAATVAEKARNAHELERHLEAMRAIGRASYCRNPRALETELDWVTAHVTEAGDVARANLLVERARAARREGNQITLRALVAEIWSLFPAPPELQRKSFGSGIR